MPSIKPTDQATFQQLLASDPEIQAVIRGVWGDTPVNQRPSSTPNNLKAANDAASKRIAQILAGRGVQLPARTFINPRSMSLEGAHGWAGLPTAAKIAIIGGLAATGIGAAGAMGAFGGTAGAASGAASAGGAAAVPGIATTAGTAGLAGIGTVVPASVGGFGAAAGGLAGAAGAAGAASVPSIATIAGTAGLGSVGTSVPASVGGFTGGSAATAGGGISAFLRGAAKKALTPAGLGAIGNSLGAVGQTAASNRGTRLDAMMEADKMKMAEGQDRRADESDLWRKIQAADYMASGGTPKTNLYSTSGAKIPSFDFGPAPISQANKDMAATLKPQLQARLNTPPTYNDYSSQMDPGKTETAMNWLGPILSGIGTFDRMTTQAPATQSTLRR